MLGKRKFEDASNRRSIESISIYWNKTLNLKKIESYSYGSNKKVHWHHFNVCGCEHTWETSMYCMTRSREQSDAIGCPTCSGTKSGVKPCCNKLSNSLMAQPRFIEIQHEWSTNEPSKPEDYYRCSNVLILWTHISLKCGCIHEWKASINNRVRQGKNCPKCTYHQSVKSRCCSNNTVLEDVELLKSWDHIKNQALGLFPKDFTIGSGKVVYWICFDTCKNQADCKHEWSARINTRKDNGCPYHHSSNKETPCCKNRSLAADRYKYIIEQIHPVDKLALGNLRLLFPSTNKKVRWICKTAKCGCDHTWETFLNHRIGANLDYDSLESIGCGFCSKPAKKICCGNHPSSIMNFEDKEKLDVIIKSCVKRGIDTSTLFITSGETIILDCDICLHEFEIIISNMTGTNKSWCVYCCGITKKLCENLDCEYCFNRRLSNWKEEDKLACFVSIQDGRKASQIALHSGVKAKFQCDKCNHIFESVLYSVTDEKAGCWCPFCCIPTKQFCGDVACMHCNQNSLASWDQIEKLECYKNANNTFHSHQIAIHSEKTVMFKCSKCQQIFEKSLALVTKKDGCWCPYCRPSGVSKIACVYIDEYEKYFNVKVQHVHYTLAGHTEGTEHKICIYGKNYKVDGYIHESDTVIEFHGDRWHGNPKMYDSDQIFSKSKNITFGDKYASTISRMALIVTSVKNLKYVWEDSFITWRKNQHLPFPLQNFTINQYT